MDQENVSATLTVAVSAARVFAVLADPATHSAIDGTGWVQEPVDREPEECREFKWEYVYSQLYRRLGL